METNKIRTDKLWVSDMIMRADDADELIEEFAAKMQISDKAHLRMRLLVEETLGMARAYLKSFEGELWLETDGSGYKIILEANVREHASGDLPAVNAPTGFMAKIAELFNCSYVFEDSSELPENYMKMLPDYISYGMKQDGDQQVWIGEWSLSSYRHSLEKDSGNPDLDSELDELEKSIVARIADDVTVGIHGRKIRMVISKKI